jgi:hypothetical protein
MPRKKLLHLDRVPERSHHTFLLKSHFRLVRSFCCHILQPTYNHVPPVFPLIFTYVEMTIIHTPRVISSLLRGLRQQSSSKNAGIGNPHKYHARVGVFDVDYLGHMNNAAFLSHAEYARWEMTAANSMLQAMYKTNTHFMVSSASCRYRAEVRPLFRSFEVQSIIGGLDDKNLWLCVLFYFKVCCFGDGYLFLHLYIIFLIFLMSLLFCFDAPLILNQSLNNSSVSYQTFRYPKEGNDRVRAQVVIKGVAVRDRKVIDPRVFLKEQVGVEPELVDALSRPSANASMEDLIAQFEDLESSYRNAAALDDDQRT